MKKEHKTNSGLSVILLMSILVVVLIGMLLSYQENNELCHSSKNLLITNTEEENNNLCYAYENLSSINVELKNNTVYYFIENRWISEKKLWESCLY
jgi:hypothetical protein